MRLAVLGVILTAGLAAAASLEVGFTAFFSTEGCPPGWEPLSEAQGRLIVSVANASNAGVTVGRALSDQEDRGHAHAYSTAADLASKSIAAIADDNQQAAHHGSYAVVNDTASHASGYPFIQLPLCRLANATMAASSSTGFGTVAHYSPDVGSCPAGWSPKQDINGRIVAPGYAEGGPVPNAAPPLASGEDRQHSHNFSVAFTTTDVSFEGVDGCCNDQPAHAGEVRMQGVTGAHSTDLPYVQLLTCVNEEPTFAAKMPPGALLFHELQCPPGWSIVTTINGRLLVSLPHHGAPGASFGGDSLAADARSPVHRHNVGGSVTLPPASVLLASGCCGGGYAATGTYDFSADSGDATGDLPLTMMPLCQQQSDGQTLGRLL